MSETVTPRPIQPEDVLDLKTVADVQLSPDGRQVAYTLSQVDVDRDDYHTTVWVVPTDAVNRADGAEGGAQVTRGPKKDSAPRWSPDGSLLAFLSDRAGGAPQLYVMPATSGGEARQLTDLELGAGPAVWSPDGATILFAARALKEPPPDKTDKAARERWEKRPRVITRAQYKTDSQGYTFDATSHLFTVPADGGPVTQITHAEADVRAASWSPDGRQIAYALNRPGVADYNISDIWVAGAGGADARRLTERQGRATSPSWSPDGATIAFYALDEQEPGMGEHVYRVWTVPAAGGPATCLTSEFDRGAYLLMPPASAPGPVWSADGQSLTFAAAIDGNIHLMRVPAAGGAVEPVATGERWLTLASAAPQAGKLAYLAATAVDPGDIHICGWDGSEERRLTQVNREFFARVALPRVERRQFESPHGGSIDGWLFLPGVDSAPASTPAPLLVQIHGGPHSYMGNNFQASAIYAYVLAARGWAVIAINPSGSGSYGKEFAHRIRARWGEYDLPEQLAAVDALAAEGIADPNRLAVTGYSYGGFMTSWVIGHSDRFKAAVVGAPLVNFESFHGTSDIGLWFSPWELRADIFRGREIYRRLSPVHYVDQAVTPTLVLHGEGDERCPIGQGEELYGALVAAGKVPTEFVRYPGGAHGFVSAGRPSHRLDYTRRAVAWLETYTKG